MKTDMPHTFTIIVKGEMTQGELTAHVNSKLWPCRIPANIVLARTSSGETMALIHTVEPEAPSAIGTRLAVWLGELPFDAPFPYGSLLWYR